MLIDWFTVFAQVINFLILVYLLKRFLFGRILKAMDDRESRISSRLENADNKLRQAEEERKKFEEKNIEIESRKEQLISLARKEAQEYKQEQLKDVKTEVELSRKRWEERINEERDQFIKNIKYRIARQTIRITRSALKDIADAELENSIANTFVKKLRGKDLKNISEDINEHPHASVLSSFDIPENIRENIRDLIKQETGRDIDIQFRRSPELICGIELRLNGYKFDWNIEKYVSDIESDLSEAFESDITKR